MCYIRFAYINLKKRPQTSSSHISLKTRNNEQAGSYRPPMLVSGGLTSNIRRPNSEQETKERQTGRPPIHVSSLKKSRSVGHFRSILGHHFGPVDPLQPSSSLVSPHYCLTPPPKRLTTLLRLSGGQTGCGAGQQPQRRGSLQCGVPPSRATHPLPPPISFQPPVVRSPTTPGLH